MTPDCKKTNDLCYQADELAGLWSGAAVGEVIELHWGKTSGQQLCHVYSMFNAIYVFKCTKPWTHYFKCHSSFFSKLFQARFAFFLKTYEQMFHVQWWRFKRHLGKRAFRPVAHSRGLKASSPCLTMYMHGQMQRLSSNLLVLLTWCAYRASEIILINMLFKVQNSLYLR